MELDLSQNYRRFPQKAASTELGLSQRIWGVDWNKHFPKLLNTTGTPVQACPSHFDEFSGFASREFPTIFEMDQVDSPFLWMESSASKENYYRLAADCFSFKSDGKLAGVFMGTPFDWSSYYIRSAGILKEFQGKKIFPTFMEYFLKCLSEYSIDRAVAEVSVNHVSQIKLFLRLGFVPTGTVNSERWGSVVYFVKYFNPKHERVFNQQFCVRRF